jgi:hypothetical protein
VTSQPQPAPGEDKTAGQYLRPLRDLAAYALVGAAAVLIFVALMRLIPDGDNQFGYRTQDSFYGFINLATIFFPLGAVLLALVVQPRHPKAQLIVVAALVEYAVMAFFGVFFGVLIGLINHADNNGARLAFEELLVRAAWLAVFGVAAYAVFGIWRGMFQVARPKAQPGVYGQPPQYNPGAYPGQPGYAPAPPGYQPQPPPPGYQPQQGYPQPGYPQQQPPWNQPASAPPATPPGPFVPQPGTPQPGTPPPGNPQPPQPHYDPTQVVPQHDPASDRTEKFDETRPGFGPADQDPPRQ